MAWLLGQGYSPATRALTLSMLRVFFDACHRHGWLPGLAPNATIYVEELPFHHDEIARFIPEFVMAQLESEAALAKLPNPSGPELGRAVDRDRPPGRGRLQLGLQFRAPRQHRLALPALRGDQNPQ